MSSPPNAPASPAAAPTKPTTLKTALTIVSLFVIVPALGSMLIWHGRCEETVIGETPSPDQKYTAQLAYKDCGPSQPVATLVRLLSPAESRRSENLLLIEGKAAIASSWTDPVTLALAVPKDAKVVYRRHVWEAVSLKFAER